MTVPGDTTPETGALYAALTRMLLVEVVPAWDALKTPLPQPVGHVNEPKAVVPFDAAVAHTNNADVSLGPSDVAELGVIVVPLELFASVDQASALTVPPRVEPNATIAQALRVLPDDQENVGFVGLPVHERSATAELPVDAEFNVPVS